MSKILDDTVTTRAIARALWRLGWPLALMMQLVAFSEATAVYWIGELLGPRALAIEATLRYVFAASAWVLGSVGIGVSAMVARSVGARDGRGLAILGNGLALTGVLWLAVAVPAVVFVDPICEVLASREVSPAALKPYFLACLLVSLPGVLVLTALLGGASGAGWTRLTLTRSITDLVLTALIVPVAIGSVGLGVIGAPIAIGGAQLVIAGFVIAALIKHRERWNLGDPAPVARWFDRKTWGALLDFGLPAQLARVATLGAFAYLAQHVARDGRDAVVAYGVSMLLLSLAFNLCAGVGRASGILVGQLAGARALDRIRRVVRTGFVAALAVAAVPVLAYAAFGGTIVQLFTDDANAIARGDAAITVIALAIPAAAVSQLFLFAFIALKEARLAGLLGIAAEIVGIVFVLAVPGDERLPIAALSIVLSNVVRAVLYAGLWKLVVLPRIERT